MPCNIELRLYTILEQFVSVSQIYYIRPGHMTHSDEFPFEIVHLTSKCVNILAPDTLTQIVYNLWTIFSNLLILNYSQTLCLCVSCSCVRHTLKSPLISATCIMSVSRGVSTKHTQKTGISPHSHSRCFKLKQIASYHALSTRFENLMHSPAWWCSLEWVLSLLRRIETHWHTSWSPHGSWRVGGERHP